MRGALGPYEMLVILGILVLLFSGKTLKQLASEVSEALQRFQHGHPGPRPELRGLEWLVLAVAVLFLELCWLASRI